LKIDKIIAAVLLLFFLISGLYYAATNSLTSDERTHITVGYMNLHFNDYRFNIEHPPLVKQLAALPLLWMKPNFPIDIYRGSTAGDIAKIFNAFIFNIGNDLDLMLFVCRIPNILISLMLGVFIYLYSKKLNGPFAGIISLSLFVFSPLFLGHSPLVTMDAPVSCFYFVTIYYLMRYFGTENKVFLIITALFFGLSLASKFSAILLIPVLYLLVLVKSFYPIHQEWKINLKEGAWKLIMFTLLLIFTVSFKKSFNLIMPALLIFAASYIFYRKRTLFLKLNYIGRTLLILLVVGFTIVILDYTNYYWFPFHSATKSFFKGFSYFEGHAQFGQDSYLLGVISKTGGWRYYFPLAMILKEPFIALLFFCARAGGIIFKKREDHRKSRAFYCPHWPIYS